MTALYPCSAFTPVAETAAPLSSSPAELAQQWAAVNETGAAVASLARVEGHEADDAPDAVAARLAGLDPEARAMAETGIGDLAMILQPGLRALVALAANGGDAAAPARVLWEEFCAARGAILSLARG